MKLTLGSARSEIAKAAGLCTSDSRVADYVNTAIRRLLPKGYWEGTVSRYRICANSACLTWPRQIHTIEALAVDSVPRKIRNEWYEFLEAGPGVMGRTSNDGLQMVDRGNACAFDDITAGSITSYIRIYSDVPETWKYIILQGHDENGNWIRTQDGTTWIDGLKVAIPTDPATPVTTTKKFSTLERVIKDKTNGVVRLYEYSGSAIVKSLAIYEPDETLPHYRRSFIPGLQNLSTNGVCNKVNVVVMAKLAYYPVANENDFLLIGNLDALVEQVRALKNYENKNLSEGMACEALAVKYLQNELGESDGSGEVIQMRVDTVLFGAGMVENVCG